MSAILLGGVVMTVAACTSPHDDGTTLTFWTIGREGEAVVKLLPEFERLHPGIHVKVQQLPRAHHPRCHPLGAVRVDTSSSVAPTQTRNSSCTRKPGP